MGTLSASYRSGRDCAAAGALGPTDDELDQRLGALYARGVAAHPELDVPEAAFGALAGSSGVPLEDDAFSNGIHAEDFYLACACLRGDARAIGRLVDGHTPMLIRNTRHIDSSPAFLDEVQQRFWDAVLVGTMSARPRLATYSGVGPLAAWLGVGVQRIALMMLRHEQAEGRALRRVHADANAVLADPELAFIKDRYREPFQRATEKAFASLDDRERMIFRLHLADGVTIERIAGVYGVSHSTVSRWIAAARTKVIDTAQLLLRAELELSPRDLESLTRLVVSQLDVSISLLAAPAA